MKKNTAKAEYSRYIKEIEGTTSDNDERIIGFSIRENKEKLIPLNKIPGLLFDKPQKIYLAREGIVSKIGRITARLKSECSMSLYVTDAYRPLRTQEIYWRRSLRETKRKYPQITNPEKIKEIVSRFTAPPERAQHCTGGSVDVLLYDLNKDKILDDFDENDESNYNELMYTDNPRVKEPEKSNRQLLKKYMEMEDFVNYPLEWWHYSYGNAEWAIYKKRKYAVYGPVENS
ncbi:MAG: M15 family metallopeptidase [Candidatus Dojkabacteria bacterium]|jgi:D-alanyl-D-alanine dipeptidase|nr:M15 family metallopeptidase [Candidatus Dojkabacteria bacterium]